MISIKFKKHQLNKISYPKLMISPNGRAVYMTGPNSGLQIGYLYKKSDILFVSSIYKDIGRWEDNWPFNTTTWKIFHGKIILHNIIS